MSSRPRQARYRGIAPMLASGSTMSAHDYERWHDARTWDPSRQAGLAIQTELEPAAWIEPLLPDQTSPISPLVPGGFDAYARIFRPYDEEDATERRERITAAAELMLGGGQADPASYSAFLPPDHFEALLSILARRTSSASSWFLLWDGHGNLNERAFSQAPKVRHPIRNLYLLRGPHSAYSDLPADPNYWWPEDRAWCVCADTDWDYSYIAGSAACINEILQACERP